MKKLIFFLVFLVIAFFLVGTCNAYAQTKWDSKEEAEEFFSLNYQNIDDHIYVPKYLKGYKPLSSNETIVMFSDYVAVKMKVVGGTFWVIQKPKTRFVAKDDKIIRLEACGNKISGFKKLEIPETVSNKPVADCCDEVLNSVDLVKQDTEEIKKGVGELIAEMKNQKPPKEEVKINSSVSEGDWTVGNTLSNIGVPILTGIAAGYAFQKETVETIPSFGAQTANGTIQWSPTETKISKSFNTPLAIGTALGSAALMYVLNKTVF